MIFPWIYRREVIEDVSFSFEAVNNSIWRWVDSLEDSFFHVLVDSKVWKAIEKRGMSNDVLKPVGEISTTQDEQQMLYNKKKCNY